MSLTLPAVLWLGLCLGQRIMAQNEYFPQPTLSAHPERVVALGQTVTLSCWAPYGDMEYALRKGENWEPLERWTRHQSGNILYFSLSSVRASDAGNFSCIYYAGMSYRRSYPSNSLELVVTGFYAKPSFQARPGRLLSPGMNVTLQCQGQVGGLTFSLLRARTWDLLQRQAPAGDRADFLLPAAGAWEPHGYRCVCFHPMAPNTWSTPSDVLHLVLIGSHLKPSLSALPSPVVAPGRTVTLRCQGPLQGVPFALLKARTLEPLQQQKPSRWNQNWVLFKLSTGKGNETGNYSCAYYVTSSELSQISEALEIWVMESLPKPTLTAWPGPELALEGNVTLRCWGPLRAVGLALFREGEAGPLQIQYPGPDGVQFPIAKVTAAHAGRYSCRYHMDSDGLIPAEPSDWLQLVVADPGNRNLLFTALSSAFFLLLAFLLLLTAFLCYRHKQSRANSLSLPAAGAAQAEDLRSCLCLSSRRSRDARKPMEETGISTVGAQERQERPTSDPPDPEAEDPQDVTYAQLNPHTLRTRAAGTPAPPPEPSLYAVIAGQ
ncbi:immunoglobulin superfamily member 1-like [Tachyglossus aculeatus]|uniref:immunoglobulin superfamily member 1-like n=1 Tax=Tachyglossus aculeatus TaxID=9261 RepID=UPI0018F4742A|nr:immunoglobulin superfamily member 1-like [Tachyglossus aculeatus]